MMSDSYSTQPRQQAELELAAFEKGRIAGEIEATRRLESEAAYGVNKPVALIGGGVSAPLDMQRPDVIEINRLTWGQRISWACGEAASLAYLVLVIYWLDTWRGDLGWNNSRAGSTANAGMYNTHILTSFIGLFFLTQAISNYRVSPINMAPWLNRSWYVLMSSAAVVSFSLSLFANVRSSPEANFWSVADWCYAMGFAIVVLHSIYSISVTCVAPLIFRMRGGNGDIGVNGGLEEQSGIQALLMSSPEQRRDRSAYSHLTSTVYTAAPISVPRGANTLPDPNSNMMRSNNNGNNSVAVPMAPGNAPRWGWNPRTGASDYWLLPRAKWAIVGFWSLGVATLMEIAALQQINATGPDTWAQGQNQDGSALNERGHEAKVVGCIGLALLLALITISYASMPPRTALVKNGILVEGANNNQNNHSRRSSISQNGVTLA